MTNEQGKIERNLIKKLVAQSQLFDEEIHQI